MLLIMKKVVQYPNRGDCDAADDMVGLLDCRSAGGRV
jgi:hypothetical protein